MKKPQKPQKVKKTPKKRESNLISEARIHLAKARVRNASLNTFLASENKPDKLPRHGRRKGKKTKLTFKEFVTDLFIMNELLDRSLKKSDTALLDILLDEFSTFPELRYQFDKGTYTINDLRTRFNRGKFSKLNELPGKVSFRYGYGVNQGYPVNFRTGTRRLTVEQAQTYIRRHRGLAADVSLFLPKGLLNE